MRVRSSEERTSFLGDLGVAPLDRHVTGTTEADEVIEGVGVGGVVEGANGVADRVNVVEGEISDVPAGPYDVVLANINRNTLLDLLPALRQRLSPGGTALLAGLLHTDREIVERKAASLELHPVDFAEENEWVAVAIRRESESSRAGSVA